MYLAILILAFILIAVLEIPPLLKQKRPRDLIVFLAIFTFSIYLGLAQLLEWPALSPLKPLLNIFS